MPDPQDIWNALSTLGTQALAQAMALGARLLAFATHALHAWPVHQNLAIALAALAIERVIGWPQALQALFGHPVEWIGAMIGRRETAWNDWQGGSPLMLRLKGALMILSLVLFWGGLAWLVHRAAGPWRFGWLAEALLASVFLAQSALRDHVRAVCLALEGGSIEQARREVGKIVGRDVSQYDESGVVTAAVESLAENTSDGIIAPAFWLALFGLPGIVAYKVVNTADSMVGHRSARFLHFGWLSARLDDVMNFIPARLTGLLLALAAALTSPSAGARAFHVMWRDARRHVSPNAGWPEAAMAGALDISLGGPRSYGGRMVDLPFMGDGRRNLAREDIRRALRLYGQMLTLTLILGFFFWLFVA